MQTYPQPDSALIDRLQAGDESALEAIMDLYKHPVLNFVYRMLGNVADAEDVAQDVFVRVYRHAADYRPAQKFSTWLFALARNAAIDQLRWRQRHPTESLENLVVASSATSPVAEAQTTELGQEIAAAIGALPEDQRTAIILSEYHGLPDAEIAAVMHCSRKSVESRLYRAKHALRERLHALLDESR